MMKILHPPKDILLHAFQHSEEAQEVMPQNLDEFYYLMSHHPFAVEILEKLYKTLRNDTTIPEFDRRYLFSPFLSPVIQGWIFENCPYLNNYRLQITDGTVVNLDILNVVDGGGDGGDGGDVSAVLHEVANVVTLVRQSYQIKDLRPVRIIYVMTPFQKRLNIFDKNTRINKQLISTLQANISLRYNYATFTNPLTNLNVNSGLTNHGEGDDDTYILIWRTEEFAKVLIHELIHYYDLEKTYELPFIPVNISNNYRHHSRELTTELQTWYLYIIYRVSQNPRLDLITVLNQEREHSLLVMAKILRHFRITDLNQFLGKNPKYMLNLNSSALYYYIFKAVVLYQPNENLKKLISPSKPCRQCKLELTNYLTNVIKQTLIDPSFRATINDLLQTISPTDDDLRMMRGELH